MTGSLRVAHVICSDAFAGVERYVSTLASAQAARGARVTVVGGAPEEMRAGIGAGVDFIPAATVRDARRALRRVGADIVNTHMSEADLAAVLSPRGGAAIVSTRHFAAPRGRSRIVRAAFGLLERRISLDISISEFVAGAVDVDSVVILTGVADGAVSASAAREPTVLVAQRLEAEKTTEIALRAWASTRIRSQGWRLLVAGEGAERASLQSLADRLGVSDSVEFLGYRADVHALMERASILLATAPAEPYGLSVVEAMARALPVVASDGGGHLETVGAVRDPALFPVGDASAAAALLDRLGGDDAARIDYGARLQSHQRDVLDVGTWADRTLTEYERVARR